MIDARYLVNTMKHIPKFEPRIVAQFTAHFFSFSDILTLEGSNWTELPHRQDPQGPTVAKAAVSKAIYLARLKYTNTKCVFDHHHHHHHHHPHHHHPHPHHPHHHPHHPHFHIHLHVHQIRDHHFSAFQDVANARGAKTSSKSVHLPSRQGVDSSCFLHFNKSRQGIVKGSRRETLRMQTCGKSGGFIVTRTAVKRPVGIDSEAGIGMRI